MPGLPNARGNIPPAVLRLLWQLLSVSFVPISQFTLSGKPDPNSRSDPRLRFMQWYTLSSRLRAAEGEGSSHFILPFISELLHCCHLSQFSVSWSCFLWLFGTTALVFQKGTAHFNCQPHRNTSSDRQLPSGNPEHHGLGHTLGILTYSFSQILQDARAERLGLPTEIRKTQAPYLIQ